MTTNTRAFKFKCPACFEDHDVTATYTDETGYGHTDCECGHRIFIRDKRDDRKVGEYINGDVTPTITIEFNDVNHDE